MRSPTAKSSIYFANTLHITVPAILALIVLATPACSSPSITDDQDDWGIEENSSPCPSGTLVNIDLPDVEVFDEPVCVVTHTAEEVTKTDFLSGASLRPECNLNELHHMKEFGYLGRISFNLRSTTSCEESLIGCSKYNFYLRFPELSRAWHLFEVRPPNNLCQYSELFWYWRVKFNDYLIFVHVRSNSSTLITPIAPYRIEVFKKTCGNPAHNKILESIDAFSNSDIIIESLPSHESAVFLSQESHNDGSNLSLNFNIPTISGCVIGDEY